MKKHWRAPRIPESLLAEMSAHAFVCGSDEVGFGSWAGPLVVCAVVVPMNWVAPEGVAVGVVTDSKQLTPATRERLYPKLQELTHCIVKIPPSEIDFMGVSTAWEVAHTRAIEGALRQHDGGVHRLHWGYKQRGAAPLVIIDGDRSVPGATALPKGDALVPAVSAASIIAKVYRDRIMRDLASQHPGYGWETNVGYGTPAHRLGLDRFGLTPHHRMSYAPMKEMRRA